jgi:hypothetical protein
LKAKRIKIKMISIRSLFGRWRGEDLKGLTERIILGIRVLSNETSERIVYGEPIEFLTKL